MIYSERIKMMVFTIVFGTLWGVIELSLGTYLQLLNIPMRGAFMACFGGIILSTTRFYVNYNFSCIYIGFFAAFIKLLSFGTFKFGPVIGIFIESVLIEGAFYFLGYNKSSIFLANILAVLEGIPHFFITSWITYGGNIFELYIKTLKKIAVLFSIKTEIYFYILLIWLFLHLILGVLSSFTSLYILRKIKNET